MCEFGLVHIGHKYDLLFCKGPGPNTPSTVPVLYSPNTQPATSNGNPWCDEALGSLNTTNLYHLDSVYTADR